MKKKSYLSILILILFLGTFTLFNFQQIEAAQIGTEVGQKAPNFSLKNMNNKEVTLRDLEGKKVFINFWASWCPPCKAEMPDIQKLQKNHGEEIKIVAVNLEEEKNKVEKYLENEDLDFTVLLDKNKKVANQYLIRAIPTSYFLNEKGIIIEKNLGVLSYEKMKENLKIE
ncbi:MAG TPA: TlpA disulfide reductase family protein [Halanaerobiales bacterium]|nr:TlpA disulfide reductase family protein [Halanaerobiales bacterium]